MSRPKNKRMAPSTIKRKKKIILKIMEENLGIVYPALQATKISRYMFNKWKEEDEDFKKEIQEIQDKTLEFVESKLFKLIKDGDKASIMFYLKCRSNGKYVERQHIQQDVSYKEPLKINIIAPPKNQLPPPDEKKLLE